MFGKKMVHVGKKIWGQMPCGEIREFDSPYLYEQAYKNEEDEIADELARLEADRELEFPEDFVLRGA